MSGRYRPMTVLVVVGLMVMSLAVLPVRVSADVSYYTSLMPSANNATYEYNYGKIHYGPVPSTGIWVANDSYYQDIYTTNAGTLFTLRTDDYNKEDWVDPESSGCVGYLPPDGANISSVWLIAKFYTRNPLMTLSYSVDGGSSWNESEEYAESLYVFTYILWNITALETWTPALVNNTDFMVKASLYPSAYIYYYLDYLGVIVYWDVGEGGGPEEPGDDPDSEWGGWDFTDDFIFQDGGIIGVMGLIGFIGLIVIPAGAVALYRNDPGQGKINLFIKLLVMWMFCMSMVMVNFAGS